MEPAEPPDIRRLFLEGTVIDEALKRAVAAAIERHRLEGRSIAVWQNGRAVMIPPAEFPKAG